MGSPKAGRDGEILKGVLLVQLILILHVLMIALLGIVVIFLGGLAKHFFWVILGGTLLILLSAVFFYRRVKAGGADLFRRMNRSGLVREHSLEVRVLGGLVSLRFGKSGELTPLEVRGHDGPSLIEDPQTIRDRELSELASLLANELISYEEFSHARKKIIGRGT